MLDARLAELRADGERQYAIVGSMADRRSLWARDAQQFVAFVVSERPEVDRRALASAAELADLEERCPDARIPIQRVWALWRAAVEASGDRALAVRYGVATRLEHMGLFGFAVMTAATARDALARAGRYLHLATDSARLEIVEARRACSVRWQRDGVRDAGHALANETVLGQIVAALRQIAGPRAVERVAFRHGGPPVDARAQIARLLGCATVWGARHDEIAIRCGVLDEPTTTANAAMSRYFEAQVRERAAQVEAAGVEPQVRRAIVEALEGGEPEARVIARRIGSSERTLRRALAREGTSFRTLVSDVRGEQARVLLGDPKLSLTDIAFALGFSEHSAFTRAFKRWFGVAPARYRRAG
jgi:AraC-like DNA-binding protein